MLAQLLGIAAVLQRSGLSASVLNLKLINQIHILYSAVLHRGGKYRELSFHFTLAKRQKKNFVESIEGYHVK